MPAGLFFVARQQQPRATHCACVLMVHGTRVQSPTWQAPGAFVSEPVRRRAHEGVHGGPSGHVSSNPIDAHAAIAPPSNSRTYTLSLHCHGSVVVVAHSRRWNALSPSSFYTVVAAVNAGFGVRAIDALGPLKS